MIFEKLRGQFNLIFFMSLLLDLDPGEQNHCESRSETLKKTAGISSHARLLILLRIRIWDAGSGAVLTPGSGIGK